MSLPRVDPKPQPKPPEYWDGEVDEEDEEDDWDLDDWVRMVGIIRFNRQRRLSISIYIIVWLLSNMNKCKHNIPDDTECTWCHMDKSLLLVFQNDKSHTERLAKWVMKYNFINHVITNLVEY